MVDTFQRIFGVFVHFADEPADAVVGRWNVKLLAINRHARNRDATAAQDFWKALDEFLQARRCKMHY
jgi:hypothetical protein